MQAQLAETAEVDCVAENSCRFLRRGKTHRIKGATDAQLAAARDYQRRGQFMFLTRAFNSSSWKWWQVWQERFTLRPGSEFVGLVMMTPE